MLGETIHITSEYLSQEVKATSMGSKVKALEAENSKLRKDLISAMDKANTAKEKAKVLAVDLRAERQLTLEKDEQLQAAKEKSRPLLPRSLKPFNRLMSTTLCSLVGTTKALSSFGGISSSTLLAWTWEVWTWRR